MRGKWILLAGLAVFLGAGFGVYTVWKREQQPAPKVEAKPAGPGPGSVVQYTGKVRAVNLTSIAAPTSGVLEDFLVKPGDEVAEGQVLGRIRNGTLEENEKEAERELERAQNKVTSLESAIIQARLDVSRAEAEAARARSEYSRTERIYQRQSLLNREGATPRKVYEAAEKDFNAAKEDSELQSAASQRATERLEGLTKELELEKKTLTEKQDELDASKAELQAAELRSPVDGVVASIAKQAGEEVQKGFPDLILVGVDLSQLQIVLEPEPPVLARLKAGVPVVIQMEEIPGAGLPSTIREIRDGKAIIEFGSPSPLIRPGMTAQVSLKLP